MSDVMGRLFETAESLRRNYTGDWTKNEDLIISASELPHVAEYVAKLQSNRADGKVLTTSFVAKKLSDGEGTVFGRRVTVI